MGTEKNDASVGSIPAPPVTLYPILAPAAGGLYAGVRSGKKR